MVIIYGFLRSNLRNTKRLTFLNEVQKEPLSPYYPQF